jgi:hypothetical protein
MESGLFNSLLRSYFWDPRKKAMQKQEVDPKENLLSKKDNEKEKRDAVVPVVARLKHHFKRRVAIIFNIKLEVFWSAEHSRKLHRLHI